MAVHSAQVSVGTTATALSEAETDSRSGSSIVVQNTDASAAVYLGKSDVATGTGYKLIAGASLALHLNHEESLYGVAASGTVVVHVLRSSV